MKSENIESWCDKDGACKVCGGEIPYGHQSKCFIYTKQKEIAELKERITLYEQCVGSVALQANHITKACHRLDDALTVREKKWLEL